jgi:hypothetical protein
MRSKQLVLLYVFMAMTIKGVCQYDAVQICLTKHSFVIKENQRITMFCDKRCNAYFVGIKDYPYIDENDPSTLLLTNADTLFEITKTDFNRIVEMCMGLSSFNILSGMYTQETDIIYDPSSISLKILANDESVRYEVLLPIKNVSERHLQQFVIVCEEILNLTNISTNKFLEKRHKLF